MRRSGSFKLINCPSHTCQVGGVRVHTQMSGSVAPTAQGQDLVVSVLWTMPGSSSVLLLCSPPSSTFSSSRSLLDGWEGWRRILSACVSGLPFHRLCLPTGGSSFHHSPVCSQVLATATSFPDSASVLVLESSRAPGVSVVSSHTFVNNPSLTSFQSALFMTFIFCWYSTHKCLRHVIVHLNDVPALMEEIPEICIWRESQQSSGEH